MENLVSIITPLYNSEKFIEETIRSVQNQSYENWEHLIVDDGSTDNSFEIVEKNAKMDSRIKLYYLDKNSGPAVARNYAIKKAKGKYFTFIDADDLWDKDFLKKSIEFNMSSKGFTFSSYRRITEEGEQAYRDFIVPQKVTYSDILKTNSISCLTAFIDSEKLQKKYMPEVQYRQDMGLWLKYLKEVKYAFGLQEVLASYRIRQNSHSRNKFQLLRPQWSFYRKVEKLNVFKSAYYFAFWIYYGLRKYKS